MKNNFAGHTKKSKKCLQTFKNVFLSLEIFFLLYFYLKWTTKIKAKTYFAMLTNISRNTSNLFRFHLKYINKSCIFQAGQKILLREKIKRKTKKEDK